MKRKIHITGLTLFFTLALFSLAFSEESMTITTYYPSPYGSYNELTTTGNTYLATTSGKVGIGTAIPGSVLGVYGGASDSTITLARANSPATASVWRYNSGTADFGTLGVDNLQFLTSGSARVFIESTGDVGIGTASPGEKLEVNGNVQATAFIATTAGVGAYKYNTSSNMLVPDYVFDPNYSLMPLDELKKFVEKNRHLPGISSSAELKKNGTASLVEQYLKNLEKIEELYLHVFQLEQRIKQLEKETK